MEYYKNIYEDVLGIVNTAIDLMEQAKEKKSEFIPSAEDYYKKKITYLLSAIVPSIDILFYSILVAEEVYNEELKNDQFQTLMQLVKERNEKL